MKRKLGILHGNCMPKHALQNLLEGSVWIDTDSDSILTKCATLCHNFLMNSGYSIWIDNEYRELRFYCGLKLEFRRKWTLLGQMGLSCWLRKKTVALLHFVCDLVERDDFADAKGKWRFWSRVKWRAWLSPFVWYTTHQTSKFWLSQPFKTFPHLPK